MLERKEGLKNKEDISKGPRGHPEKAPKGPSWGNLSNKVINDSDGL